MSAKSKSTNGLPSVRAHPFPIIVARADWHLWPWFWRSVGVVLLGAGIGVVAALSRGAGGHSDAIVGVAGRALNSNDSFSLWFFFRRNTTNAIGALAGLGLLGLPAIFVLLTTGASIGYGITVATQAQMPLTIILAALLPHGVVELPGICLAGACGLTGCHGLRDLAAGRQVRIAVDWRSLSRSVFAILILLALAAAIESKITAPLLVRLTVPAHS